MKKLLIIALVALSAGAWAQQIGKWERLGTVSASATLDKDVIDCASKGLFNALKFKITGGRAIDFKAVYVQYGNGVIDNLDFNNTVRPGGESPILDLKGNNRIIKKITIVYKTVARGNLKQAQVTVWGRHP